MQSLFFWEYTFLWGGVVVVVCVCLHLWVHANAPVYGDQKWTSTFLVTSFSFSFETGPFSLNLELNDWLDKLANKSQGSSCLPPDLHWGGRRALLCPAFYVAAVEMSSDI